MGDGKLAQLRPIEAAADEEEDVVIVVDAAGQGVHVAGVIESGFSDEVGVIIFRGGGDAGEEMQQPTVAKGCDVDVEGGEIAGREKFDKIGVGANEAVLVKIKAKPGGGCDRT